MAILPGGVAHALRNFALLIPSKPTAKLPGPGTMDHRITLFLHRIALQGAPLAPTDRELSPPATAVVVTAVLAAVLLAPAPAAAAFATRVVRAQVPSIAQQRSGKRREIAFRKALDGGGRKAQRAGKKASGRGLENAAQRRGKSSEGAVRLLAFDGGYSIRSDHLRLQIDPAGAIRSIACGATPICSGASIEIRDRTWHIKLYPHPELTRLQTARVESDGAHLKYLIRIADSATGIQADMQESVLVKPDDRVDVTVTVLPQVTFQAHRISWNVQFPANALVGRPYTVEAHGTRVNGAFPETMASNPHLARNFDLLEVSEAPADLIFHFSSDSVQNKSAPVRNVLEDLRWWKADRFWVAAAAPYGPEADDMSEAPEINAGELRTFRVSLKVNCRKALFPTPAAPAG